MITIVWDSENASWKASDGIAGVLDENGDNVEYTVADYSDYMNCAQCGGLMPAYEWDSEENDDPVCKKCRKEPDGTEGVDSSGQ